MGTLYEKTALTITRQNGFILMKHQGFEPLFTIRK